MDIMKPGRADPYCLGCDHMDTAGGPTYGSCLYILRTGRRRPCDPGRFCTVRQMSYDAPVVEHGRITLRQAVGVLRLRNNGYTQVQTAEIVGISLSSVQRIERRPPYAAWSEFRRQRAEETREWLGEP